MLKKIVHIGVAVRDLEASVRLFTDLYQRGPVHREEVRDQKVLTAMFSSDGPSLELLQATDHESPIARFIEKWGEGIHHVSFEVDDIETELQRLSSLGFVLIDKPPRPGAGGYLVAFLHPRSTNGVLIEIGQRMASGYGE